MAAFLRIAIALVLFVAPARPARAQRGQPPPGAPRDTHAGGPAVPVGTASISGIVGVAGVGVPAPHAPVTLSATHAGGYRPTATDDNGRFVFSGLLGGRYSLSASKPGHVSVSYGQTKPGRPGTPIQLSDGQQFNARLLIYKGGVITGTVLDENGEAV